MKSIYLFFLLTMTLSTKDQDTQPKLSTQGQPTLTPPAKTNDPTDPKTPNQKNLLTAPSNLKNNANSLTEPHLILKVQASDPEDKDVGDSPINQNKDANNSTVKQDPNNSTVAQDPNSSQTPKKGVEEEKDKELTGSAPVQGTTTLSSDKLMRRLGDGGDSENRRNLLVV